MMKIARKVLLVAVLAGGAMLASAPVDAFAFPLTSFAQGKMSKLAGGILQTASGGFLDFSEWYTDSEKYIDVYPYGHYRYPGYHPSPTHDYYYADDYDYPYPYWKWYNPSGNGFNHDKPHAHSKSSNAHVAWCEEHYRSYRVATNTWVSYSGRIRSCVSPYGP